MCLVEGTPLTWAAYPGASPHVDPQLSSIFFFSQTLKTERCTIISYILEIISHCPKSFMSKLFSVREAAYPGKLGRT